MPGNLLPIASAGPSFPVPSFGPSSLEMLIGKRDSQGQHQWLRTMESEDEFLRHWVVRLRGALTIAASPEIQTILREAIIAAEDRLDVLDEEKLGPAKR